MSLKSDIGARAAWKGFSSQTTYIAYRLMILEDEFDMFPENVEDLMIKEGNEVKELIQIKNISADLSLSDFKPSKEDSFFRRILSHKTKDLKVVIISFGNIGFELQELNKKSKEGIKIFKRKMLAFNYKEDEIDWIINHIEIKKESEEILKEKIFEQLRKSFKAAIGTDIVFNCLINYISNLSRKVEKTNNKIWNDKVNQIVKDILSIKGMQEQYGKTILNLSDYKTNKSIEMLKEEYKNGIDAIPDHIRNGLDIYRKKWISKIEDGYKENNIVLIRGISGQGKSSLAYRFLIDNFNEEFVFVVEHINDSKQAEDILMAINGLACSKEKDTIIYIDITPYDMSWKWILEQVYKRNLNIKLLITIREEDYRRANINLSLYNLKEIEITLERDEAEELYNRYGSNYFLNFEEAWNNFGKTGPFMEFMYLLSAKQKLQDKLNNQIDNIIENESDADNWLKLILIISYAGKDNYKIDFEKLSEIINSCNFSKMLKNLEKEYLIKFEKDSKYIISTHALRAKILLNIITKKIYFNKTKLIIDVLSCMIGYNPTLIAEFLSDNPDNADEFFEEATVVKYKAWDTYATLVRSALWMDTYELYIENKEIIDKGDKISNDCFTVLFIVDITGYTAFDREEHLEVLESINQDSVRKVRESVDFAKFKIKYYYTDLVLNNIKKNIEAKKVLINDDYSKIGYILFWMAQRNIYVSNLQLVNIDYSKFEQILDLMVGLKVQKMDDLYFIVLENIKKIFIQKYNVINLIEDDEISVNFLNMFNEEKDNKNYFEKVMEVIYCIRRMYYNRTEYNVKILGTDFLEGFDKMPDTEKHIKCENLNLNWITNINNQFGKMADYNKRVNSWKEYKQKLDEINEQILEFIKLYCIGLDCYYKNGNINKLTDEKLIKLEQNILNTKNISKAPKCTVNKYGLDNSLYSVQIFRQIEENDEVAEENNQNNKVNEKQFKICIKFEKFLQSLKNFINQKNTAFLSKIQKKKEMIDLSIFNISDSLNEYTNFLIEYEKLFGESELNKNLYENLKILTIFWEKFCNDSIIKNKSKLYDIKLIKKKKEKGFVEYISENIDKYMVNINNEKYYNIDLEKIDEFFENLYEPYKHISLTSYEAFLLQEYQKLYNNKIRIIYSVQENQIPIGIEIKINQMLYSKSVAEFVKKQFQQNYEDIFSYPMSDRQKVIYNLLFIICKLKDLKIINRYIVSVNSELVEINNINTNSYEVWCTNVKTMEQEEIKEIINILKFISGNFPEEQVNVIKEFIEKFSKYIKLLDDIVRQKKLDKFFDFESVQDFFMCLLDLYLKT